MSLRVFSAALQHASKNYKDSQAIQMKKQKFQQDRELFDLKKKKAEIGLKEAEMSGEMTEFELQNQRQLQKEYFGKLEDINKGKKSMLDLAEHKTSTELNQAKKAASTLLKTDPEVQQYMSQFDPVQASVQPFVARTDDGKFERKYPDASKIRSMAKDMAMRDLGYVTSLDVSEDEIRQYMPQARNMIYQQGQIDIPQQQQQEQRLGTIDSVRTGIRAGKQEKTVPMLDPDGNPVNVPEINVERVIEMGFQYE